MKRALAILGCLAFFACGGDDDQPDTPDATVASPDADTGPTWASFADNFFETFCQECHGPGDLLRDYSEISMVRAESVRIRSGVASGQFPVGNGPFPTDDQRDILLAWIDAGAPD